MRYGLHLSIVLAIATAAAPTAAQTPKLQEVARRVGSYVAGYATELAAVVAEETYLQTLESGSAASTRRRILRSDYALVRVDERDLWIGYRDTFEVDGRSVRDREERLQRLLATGAAAQAARIAEENARFNLEGGLLTRNINVPTFALELLHPRRRDRFSVRRSGTETLADGRTGWVLEFRERDKPTIVRQPDGRDQASRVLALIDPLTGTVMRTTLTWQRVEGSIVVTYGLVPGISVPVPLTMTERYTTQGGSTIGGEATYANYRRFQTSGRLIEP